MCSLLHPALILIVAGLLLPLLRGVYRNLCMFIAPIIVLVLVWAAAVPVDCRMEFMGIELQVLHLDSLSRLFVTVFSIMAFAGLLFAYRQAGTVELSAALVYAGASLGVCLAGDMITLFVFWEIMALASTVVIWSGSTSASAAAGMRYVIFHLLGGVLLMAGIIAWYHDTGSVIFSTMTLDNTATWFIFAGFMLNAAAPPLSAWLADAYPQSSCSGMVFLSAFTTKTAVYVLMRGFPGTELLIIFGLLMILYSIVYALLENNVRRMLAYSIINQSGIMICGIGIGTEMALNGAAAHAFSSVIYQALLIMSAGSVVYMTGKRNCTDLGGLFRSMPVTAACGIVGALAISSFPLASGFVSKSMVSQAGVDNNLFLVWLALQAASAGVILHAGLKFPWLVFFHRDSGLRPCDPPMNMQLAMILFAILCLFIGIFPGTLYAMLPYAVDYVPYTADHVLAQLQLLLFSCLAFFLMLPWVKANLGATHDFDWIYRVLLNRAFCMLHNATSTFVNRARELVITLLGHALHRLNGIVLSGQRQSLFLSNAILLSVAFLLIFLSYALGA